MKTTTTNNPQVDLVIGDTYPGLTGDAKVNEENATPETLLPDLISPTDYQYQDIPNMTVGELRTRMQKGEEYYDLVPVDSVIREVHFSSISNAYAIPYDVVYYTWLGKPEKAQKIRDNQ